MLVFRHPCALRGVNRAVEVVDDGRGRITGLERGRVHERLERRTRLAARLRGAVVVAPQEVAAADESAHLAGARIERDERGLEFRRVAVASTRAAAFLERFEHLLHIGIGGALHVDVNGGVDLQPALVDSLFAETGNKLTPHVFLEESAIRLFLAERIVQDDLARLCLFQLGIVDDAHLVHLTQHHGAARERAIQVRRRRVARWSFDETGEQRGLGDSKC